MFISKRFCQPYLTTMFWHHCFIELTNVLPIFSRLFHVAASVATEMGLGEGRGGALRSPNITWCFVRGVAHIWSHAQMETGKNSALRDSSYWIVMIFHFRPYFASLRAFQVFIATVVRRLRVFALDSEIWRRSWPFRRHFITSEMKVQEIKWQVNSLHKEYTHRKEFIEGKYVYILKWNYQKTSFIGGCRNEWFCCAQIVSEYTFLIVFLPIVPHPSLLPTFVYLSLFL
jgi:hypothetical protein